VELPSVGRRANTARFPSSLRAPVHATRCWLSKCSRPYSESFDTRCTVQSLVVSHQCEVVAQGLAQHERGRQLQCITCAQTVPSQITLKGCDGKPLAPGAYRLRALVGYGSDALNNAQGGASGAFVMASEPVDLTIT